MFRINWHLLFSFDVKRREIGRKSFRCETEGSRAAAGPHQGHTRPVFWLKLLRVDGGGGAAVVHLRPLNLNTSPAERFYLTVLAPLLLFVAEETLEEVKGGGLTI